jgi:hypothetical protein
VDLIAGTGDRTGFIDLLERTVVAKAAGMTAPLEAVVKNDADLAVDMGTTH